MLIRDRQLITYSKGVLIDGTSRFASTYEFRNCLLAEVVGRGGVGGREGGRGRRKGKKRTKKKKRKKEREREKRRRRKKKKRFASK